MTATDGPGGEGPSRVAIRVRRLEELIDQLDGVTATVTVDGPGAKVQARE
ncbi:hypothetical protein [Streptomyces sp.]|nr:hypothetical protein [Streptomyces sp.]HZF87796.1 hypothetical protein [Streptomyces sp.]